jgi:hypothetical protein
MSVLDRRKGTCEKGDPTPDHAPLRSDGRSHASAPLFERQGEPKGEPGVFIRLDGSCAFTMPSTISVHGVGAQQVPRDSAGGR